MPDDQKSSGQNTPVITCRSNELVLEEVESPQAASSSGGVSFDAQSHVSDFQNLNFPKNVFRFNLGPKVKIQKQVLTFIHKKTQQSWVAKYVDPVTKMSSEKFFKVVGAVDSPESEAKRMEAERYRSEQ